MAKEGKVVFISDSPEDTLQLGERIGSLLFEGIVIRLVGDLGSGKTHLVKGIARGLNVPPTCSVTSPTFTLINEYNGRIPLYHVDLYRLSTAVDFEDIGLLDILYDEAVVVIEWAEKLSEAIEDYITIRLAILDDCRRRIIFEAGRENTLRILKKLER